MNSSRFFPSFLLATAMSALLLTAARGEDDTSTIKFSDSSKPGTLKIAVSNGDIRVQGADTNEIAVRTELKPEGAHRRKDGLRVLTSSASYSLTEKDNVVSLSHGSGSWPGSGSDFKLTVPRNTSIVISNALGGDLRIADVSGDLEVKSLNGEVDLKGVSGGALVETMNGEIEVDVKALAEGKALSFTSMNGEVKINLPADAKANVHLRTHNGSILTDFDEKQLVTKTTSMKKTGRHGMTGLSSDDANEIRVAVRDAVRVGVEVAREAGRAARDAMREAQREAGGAIEDEEEIEHDDTPDVVPVPPVPPLPPMTGGKTVTGTLNGGGPEIRITTMNGDVTLRKAAP